MISELAFYHTFIGKISIPSKVTEPKKKSFYQEHYDYQKYQLVAGINYI